MAGRSQRQFVFFGLAGLLLLGVAALHLMGGAEWLSPTHFGRLIVWKLAGGSLPVGMDAPRAEAWWAILTQIRLPRLLAAALTGAALAVAGAGMQGLFRNPLADPSLTGISAGSAMGAVTVMMAAQGLVGHRLTVWGLTPLAALLGGIAATAIVYALSRYGGRVMVGSLLLTGLAANALGLAYVGLLLYFATYGQVREFQFWILGSLAGLTWSSVGMMTLLLGPPLLLYPRLAPSLNALLLGESEAAHLGVDVRRLHRYSIAFSALLVGGTVAFCGMIGFLGLIVPHLVRLRLGPDHRTLFPGCAMLGATLLLTADLLARSLAAPADMPVGIFTALLGAPYFLFLLRTTRHHGLV